MGAASGSGHPTTPPLLADLRSDTVTRPSPGMLKAMADAEVGDDVLGDDPTVKKCEALFAAHFGMEAGLYCPSGTMTNQIAIKVHTQPGDELICADSAHIYLLEGGGIAFNSGVQAKPLPSDLGRISAAQVSAAINKDDVHFPATRLVCLENTTNRGGGACYTLDTIKEIGAVCRSRGLAFHLDGARIFNAIVAQGYSASQIGEQFDSISVCLSKGLGCPVGSVLLGSKELVRRARRVRKVLGGGMRQAGFLAAAGIYALQSGHVESLADDHKNARRVSHTLISLPWVASIKPVETNIVIFDVVSSVKAAEVVVLLVAHGIRMNQVSPSGIRLVWHRDVTAARAGALDDVLAVLKHLPISLQQ